MVKFHANVIHVGPLVREFTEAGILVFFGKNAPEELYEFSVIHDGEQLNADITPGDSVVLDGESYKVLAVGEVANQNFTHLGHLVMKFNGSLEAELPGDVCVENRPVHPIHVGSTLDIVSEQ